MDPDYERTLHEQLDFLNERMKETSVTANAFLGKYSFGGMVAIIALLNVDLVLLPEDGTVPLYVVGIALGISLLYFGVVARHYREHRESHRKLKYKFELTLHALLRKAPPEAYGYMLEQSLLDPVPQEPVPYPGDGREPADHAAVSAYLLDHHRRKLRELRNPRTREYWDFVLIPMILVVLTLTARLA